jgi:hypothetical protein
LGYARIGTYIRLDEPGTSLVAAGWRRMGLAGGGSWDRLSRARTDKTEPVQRQLFELAA